MRIGSTCGWRCRRWSSSTQYSPGNACPAAMAARSERRCCTTRAPIRKAVAISPCPSRHACGSSGSSRGSISVCIRGSSTTGARASPTRLSSKQDNRPGRDLERETFSGFLRLLSRDEAPGGGKGERGNHGIGGGTSRGESPESTNRDARSGNGSPSWRRSSGGARAACRGDRAPEGRLSPRPRAPGRRGLLPPPRGVARAAGQRPRGRPSLRRLQRLRLTLRSYDFFQISNVTIIVLASLYWCVFILSETLFVSSTLPLLSVRVWSASAYGFPSAPPGISIV